MLKPETDIKKDLFLEDMIRPLMMNINRLLLGMWPRGPGSLLVPTVRAKGLPILPVTEIAEVGGTGTWKRVGCESGT